MLMLYNITQYMYLLVRETFPYLPQATFISFLVDAVISVRNCLHRYCMTLCASKCWFFFSLFTYYACHWSLQPEININECAWQCVQAQSHSLICESAAINYIYSEISAEHLHVWIMYWAKSSTLWFMHFCSHESPFLTVIYAIK